MDSLKEKLDTIVEEYEKGEYVENDPVQFLQYNYPRQEDFEIVGMIASCLAYGRADVFQTSIREVLQPLHPTPTSSLLEKFGDIEKELGNFSYRMTQSEDVIDLLYALREVVKHSTLEEVYASSSGSHIERSSHLVQELRSLRKRDSLERGFKYLIPDPEDGSACKRLNLFFRWMVRKNSPIDVGLWDLPKPHQLIIPLDTHIHRISKGLGLTNRKTSNLKTAQEITDKLKDFDKEDPLKYDFALCHIGMNHDENELQAFTESN